MSSSKWLEQQLNETYLPLIATWQDNQAGRRKAKKLLKDLRSDWTKRELITIAQQKNCMAQVRRAIKDEFGEDHFSLDYIKFSTDEYTDLNSAAQARVSDRNENVQYLKDPEVITAKAVRLLESKEWAEIAAGLSVLTGTRVAELVSTAHFEPTAVFA
ncbi:MAG: telomere resolvase [Drouetiella hepatica Uher 2000/2452]|jgi:tRNA splicing ligase|uniref:Telomere resolvase n=1 Tax=Drouetiella hepatica Uher 2000/2452 TaxID=904376 RepID=A0A951QEJ4_9CYAN|nr:telomere resolvase [Drouetiella hepatica Uher 2000/2452]